VAKRRTSPDLAIAATLAWHDGAALIVCDSGAAIPEALAQQLFATPVASAQGLGVGLYQAARLATSSGYRLQLDSNVPGKVRFALRKATGPEAVTAGDPQPPAG
jgi:C4-dicarboxylate-specific signal transduction histidine kinase